MTNIRGSQRHRLYTRHCVHRGVSKELVTYYVTSPPVRIAVSIMSTAIHPRVDAIAELMLILWDASCEPARKPVRRRESDLAGKHCTLRPGSETPLWNQLVKTVRPMLRKRGEKTLLSRELRLPRQRVHEFLVSRTAQPDAERALHILAWVAQRWSRTRR